MQLREAILELGPIETGTWPSVLGIHADLFDSKAPSSKPKSEAPPPAPPTPPKSEKPPRCVSESWILN